MIKYFNLNKLVILYAFAFMFFYPLSLNGEALSSTHVLVEWSLFSLLIVFCMCIHTIDLKRMFISGCLLAYLTIATLVIILSEDFRFSISRLAPVVCSLVIMCFNFKNEYDKKFLISLLNKIIIIIICINILLLLNIIPVRQFIVAYYTQYKSYITDNFIALGRPIGVFGVGNIAAFFYTGIFLISMMLYQQTMKRTYLIYMLLMFALCLRILNTTSLGYACLMITYYIYTNYIYNRKSFAIIIVIFFGIISVVLFGSSLFGTFWENQQAGANGFCPRYLNATGIFSKNLSLIKEYPLGIGYSLPNNDQSNIYFADSGYLVSYTMGNIVFPITLYTLFYKWIGANIKTKEYRIVFRVYVFLMELGFVTFLALRSISLLFILMIFYSSFENKKQV